MNLEQKIRDSLKLSLSPSLYFFESTIAIKKKQTVGNHNRLKVCRRKDPMWLMQFNSTKASQALFLVCRSNKVCSSKYSFDPVLKVLNIKPKDKDAKHST